MKIAWSVGHDPVHRGAHSFPLMKDEHFIAEDVFNVGMKLYEKEYSDLFEIYHPIVDVRDLSAGGVLNRKIQMINSNNCDYACETHFNSSGNPQANGCEVLYFSLPGINRFSKEGKYFAQLMQGQLLYYMNAKEYTNHTIKDRGIKGMADIRRVYNGVETIPRYAFLTKTKMPAIIVEPLFISNTGDTEQFRINYDGFIERLALAHLESFRDLTFLP